MTAYLFVLGLCFGSFALATAWRIKHKKGFVRDTSECESCHHKLHAKDLVPLFSWLSLGGKCRYCHKKITVLVPLAELIGGVLYGASYYFWPVSLHGFLALAMFVVWLVALIMLLVLFFYDLQWFILPNKVMYPLYAVAGVYALMGVISDPTTAHLLNLAGAILVSRGLFWLFYTVSKGTWIGFGDVRLGLVMGLLASTPAKAGIALFAASLSGILITLPSILSGSRKLTSKVPFGPLLIIGLVISMLFGQRLIDSYMTNILLL